MDFVDACRHSVSGVSSDGELKAIVVLYPLKRSVVWVQVSLIFKPDTNTSNCLFLVICGKCNFESLLVIATVHVANIAK